MSSKVQAPVTKVAKLLRDVAGISNCPECETEWGAPNTDPVLRACGHVKCCSCLYKLLALKHCSQCHNEKEAKENAQSQEPGTSPQISTTLVAKLLKEVAGINDCPECGTKWDHPNSPNSDPILRACGHVKCCKCVNRAVALKHCTQCRKEKAAQARAAAALKIKTSTSNSDDMKPTISAASLTIKTSTSNSDDIKPTISAAALTIKTSTSNSVDIKPTISVVIPSNDNKAPKIQSTRGRKRGRGRRKKDSSSPNESSTTNIESKRVPKKPKRFSPDFLAPS